MIRVLFVCHGNICRSPMAELLFQDMVKKKKQEDKFYIASAATSDEEIGNPVHRGTKRILDSLGIDSHAKRAVRLVKSDYEKYDFILAMDYENIRNIRSILGEDYRHKVHLLLEYAGLDRGIKDPWYTGDFEETYQDITEGLSCFYQFLKENRIWKL